MKAIEQVKVNRTIRRRVNTRLAELSSRFHEWVPLEAIREALAHGGLQLLDEDGEPWEGFLCGADGRAVFNMNAPNSMLVLSWHRFETTRRFEVNAYIS